MSSVTAINYGKMVHVWWSLMLILLVEHCTQTICQQYVDGFWWLGFEQTPFEYGMIVCMNEWLLWNKIENEQRWRDQHFAWFENIFTMRQVA